MNLSEQAKILSLTDDQWDELEERCTKILKLPSDWKEKSYEKTVAHLRAKDRSSNYSPFKLYYKDKIHKEDIKPKREVPLEDDNLTLF